MRNARKSVSLQSSCLKTGCRSEVDVGCASVRGSVATMSDLREDQDQLSDNLDDEVRSATLTDEAAECVSRQLKISLYVSYHVI